jgi:hypothetical protein
MQEGQPITFFSKKFGLKLQAAFVYIKELHAITKAVLKWRQRQYLLRHFFVIRTNHKSIRELLHQVIQTPDQKVYVRKLLGFQFRIEYKPEIQTRLPMHYLVSRLHGTVNMRLLVRHFKH